MENATTTILIYLFLFVLGLIDYKFTNFVFGDKKKKTIRGFYNEDYETLTENENSLQVDKEGNIKEVSLVIKNNDIDGLPIELKKEFEKTVYNSKIDQINNEYKKTKEPVKVKFEEALYMIRHYKKKALVSEDGTVRMAVDNFTDYDKEDFEKTFDPSKVVTNAEEIISSIEDIKGGVDDVYEVSNKEHGITEIKGKTGRFIVQGTKILETPKTRTEKEEEEKSKRISKEIENQNNYTKIANESDASDSDTPSNKITNKDIENEASTILNSLNSSNEVTEQKDKEVSNLLEEVKTLEKENRRIIEDSFKDPLTRTYNRKKFEIDSIAIFEEDNIQAMAFVDGDKFKNVNDTYGHSAGDLALKKMAESMFDSKREFEKNFKSMDVYRYGGEEFVIIFSGINDVKDVFSSLEFLRVSMEKRIISYCEPAAENHKEKKYEFCLTLSIGVAFKMNLKNCNSSALLLNRADESVYEAKENGRNRICVSEQNGYERDLFNSIYKYQKEEAKVEVKELLSDSTKIIENKIDTPFDIKKNSNNKITSECNSIRKNEENKKTSTEVENTSTPNNFSLSGKLDEALVVNKSKITQASLFENNNILDVEDVDFPIDEFSDLLKAKSSNEIEELLIKYLVPENYHKIKEDAIDFLRVHATFEGLNTSKGLLKKRLLKLFVSEILPIGQKDKELVINKFVEDVNNINATVIYLNNFFANSAEVMFKVIDNEVVINKKQELEFILKQNF